MLSRIALAALALAASASATTAATLWSTKDSYLGPGVVFGPGALPLPSPMFDATIRKMAFHTDTSFVTPFFHNGVHEPNVPGPAGADGAPFDGVLADGSQANEHVTLGEFKIAGTVLRPYVANTGRLRGQQMMVTDDDGNVSMTMDLVLDMGIGERGLIKMPFHGTTGTVEVPYSMQTEAGGKGVDQAGPLKSGETIAGRIGDFNGDGFIDGTLVAVGRMPLSAPLFPGQPFALIRHFETDIAVEGTIMGAAQNVDDAYARDNR